jgi:predicted RNase H-like nuclease (RuvC/YqgF family)
MNENSKFQMNSDLPKVQEQTVDFERVKIDQSIQKKEEDLRKLNEEREIVRKRLAYLGDKIYAVNKKLRSLREEETLTELKNKVALKKEKMMADLEVKLRSKGTIL